MPDLSQFITVSVNGIPLVAVLIGLVEYFKRLGATGRQLQIISMALGIVLGAGYQLATLPPEAAPTTTQGSFAFVFGVVIYGLALGLIASGIFDAADSIFKKALGR